jgi:hypothetical protein
MPIPLPIYILNWNHRSDGIPAVDLQHAVFLALEPRHDQIVEPAKLIHSAPRQAGQA